MVLQMESQLSVPGYGNRSPTDVTSIKTVPMFSEVEVCYECNCTVIDGRDYLELATWIYLGFVKMQCNSTDCDVPYHFHRFAKFDDYHRWKQRPDIEPPCINLTSTAQVQRRFINRQAMVDSVLDWHHYLSDNSATE